MSDEKAPPFLTAMPEEWAFDSKDDLVENAFIAGMAWQEHQDKSALASERAARTAVEALLHKLMLVVDDDEQIYNKDTDHERLMRAKRLIATRWGLDDFEWEPDE